MFASKKHQKLYNAYRRGEASPRGNPHILIAAMPKSGSSFLVTALANLPGFERVAVIAGHDRRENELALDVLMLKHDRSWVAQAHVRHSVTTSRMMRAFGITPIVQVRNLFDIVMSRHDHLMNISKVSPIAYVPKSFAEWSLERRLLFIADTCIPWYINFYMSWQDTNEKLIVNYDDLIRQPEVVLRRILVYANVDSSSSDQANAVRSAMESNIKTRNVITPGRGTELPPVVKQHIERLASYYSDFDFSDIGL